MREEMNTSESKMNHKQVSTMTNMINKIIQYFKLTPPLDDQTNC